MTTREWTFLTCHGRVLVYVAKHPQATCREIAQETDVTERAIQKVICDLVTEGYLVRQKIGRHNVYTIHPELPMRHRLEREYAVGEILHALGYNPGKETAFGNIEANDSTQPGKSQEE